MGMIEARVEVRRRQVIDASSSDSEACVSTVSRSGIDVVAKSFSGAKTIGRGSDTTAAENVPVLVMKLRRKVPLMLLGRSEVAYAW